MKLCTVVCFALLAQIRAHPLQLLIEDLSESVGARTNVFFGFTGEHAVQEIMLRTSLPKLLITEPTDFHLRNSFGTKILSIVYVEEQPAIDSLLLIVKAALNRLLETDVLFVTEKDTSDMQQWKWLFQWCWQNGFYNVLLTDINGSLLTFDPFPHLQVMGTNLGKYMQNRNNWRDFKGYPIRVGIGNNPPRALAYKNKTNGLVISGHLPLSLKAFIRRYNATLITELMPHYEDYSMLDCLNSLKQGTVDICGDSVSANKSYIISEPLQLNYGFLIVPSAQPINKFRYFLTPFSTNLWLLIGLTICYITIMTSLIYWKQTGAWDIGKFFLHSVSSMLYISFNISTIKRYFIIHLVLIVAGFILTNLYLALLSSVLTTDVFGHQISSLDEIRDRNLTILIKESNRIGLRMFNASNMIQQQMKNVSENILNKHRNKLDRNYLYYCLKYDCKMYLYQQKFLLRPRMTMFEQPIVAAWGGIPMQNNWQFRNYFHKHQRLMVESGLDLHHKKTAFQEAIASGLINFFKTEYYDVVPLNLEYFQLPAALLGFGFLAALMVFIVEITYYHFKYGRAIAISRMKNVEPKNIVSTLNKETGSTILLESNTIMEKPTDVCLNI